MTHQNKMIRLNHSLLSSPRVRNHKEDWLLIEVKELQCLSGKRRNPQNQSQTANRTKFSPKIFAAFLKYWHIQQNHQTKALKTHLY